MTMTLIETVTVGSGGVASILFSAIPQDGTDLLLVISARSSSNREEVLIRPNSATANLSARRLLAAGAGAAANATAQTFIGARMCQSSHTANTFGNSRVYINNYASDIPKNIAVLGVNENMAAAAQQTVIAGLWNDNSAITSLLLIPDSDNLVQHSTASLYKITKA